MPPLRRLARSPRESIVALELAPGEVFFVEGSFILGHDAGISTTPWQSDHGEKKGFFGSMFTSDPYQTGDVLTLVQIENTADGPRRLFIARGFRPMAAIAPGEKSTFAVNRRNLVAWSGEGNVGVAGSATMALIGASTQDEAWHEFENPSVVAFLCETMLDVSANADESPLHIEASALVAWEGSFNIDFVESSDLKSRRTKGYDTLMAVVEGEGTIWLGPPTRSPFIAGLRVDSSDDMNMLYIASDVLADGDSSFDGSGN